MRFVITAGPTREYLDPVRFLSNPSTGRMGFAIASAASRRGYAVDLVAGPVSLLTPKGVVRHDVVSAREMLSAVERLVVPRAGDDEVVLISTAAIADWRPAKCAAEKLKKREMSATLRLVRNPDILKTVKALRRRLKLPLRLVGFAAETNDVLAEAARKCREKGLEFIVANDVTKPGSGFGTVTNEVTLVFPDGRLIPCPLQSKAKVAAKILKVLV